MQDIVLWQILGSVTYILEMKMLIGITKKLIIMERKKTFGLGTRRINKR